MKITQVLLAVSLLVVAGYAAFDIAVEEKMAFEACSDVASIEEMDWSSSR